MINWTRTCVLALSGLSIAFIVRADQAGSLARYCLDLARIQIPAMQRPRKASELLGAHRGWGTGATSRKPLRKNATDIAADDLLDLLIAYVEGLSQRRGH